MKNIRDLIPTCSSIIPFFFFKEYSDNFLPLKRTSLATPWYSTLNRGDFHHYFCTFHVESGNDYAGRKYERLLSPLSSRTPWEPLEMLLGLACRKCINTNQNLVLFLCFSVIHKSWKVPTYVRIMSIWLISVTLGRCSLLY